MHANNNQSEDDEESEGSLISLNNEHEISI